MNLEDNDAIVIFIFYFLTPKNDENSNKNGPTICGSDLLVREKSYASKIQDNSSTLRWAHDPSLGNPSPLS